MVLCDRNGVILWIKRARCSLNKEIIYLLMRKAFLERSAIEVVYKLDEKSTVRV